MQFLTRANERISGCLIYHRSKVDWHLLYVTCCVIQHTYMYNCTMYML